jgi:hypothetical protein
MARHEQIDYLLVCEENLLHPTIAPKLFGALIGSQN